MQNEPCACPTVNRKRFTFTAWLRSRARGNTFTTWTKTLSTTCRKTLYDCQRVSTCRCITKGDEETLPGVLGASKMGHLRIPKDLREAIGMEGEPIRKQQRAVSDMGGQN